MFDATHALLLELFGTGHIDGFRVDHPDGLADPRRYFARMAGATGGAWVVAEKILEADEEVPAEWQVAGTTGYDALWRIQSLFVDPAGDHRLGGLMEELTGDERGDLSGMVRQAKREIVETVLQRGGGSADLPADRRVLGRRAAARPRTRAIRDCATALLVELDRYRAYVVPGEAPSRLSEDVMTAAARRARDHLDPQHHDTLRLSSTCSWAGRPAPRRAWTRSARS